MPKIYRDVATSTLIALVAAIVYWKTLSIPPGLYDPLGAGTMPRIVAVGIVIFSAISIAQSLLRHRAQAAKSRKPPAVAAAKAPDRPVLAVGTFLFMLVLAISLQFRIPFAIAAPIFLFVTIMTVERLKVTSIPKAVLLSVIVGVGTAYLFTDVFTVDLP